MEIKLPHYFKYAVILLLLFLLLWFLQTFKSVFMPLAFAILLAFLLLPTTQRLESWRVPRPLAILLSLILVVVLLSLLIWFLSSQLLTFAQELPSITAQLENVLESVQRFLLLHFDIQPTTKTALLRNALDRLQESGTAFVGRTISITTGALTLITLLPVFIFFLLYYRDHFRHFMFMFTTKDRRPAMTNTINSIGKVVQSYLSGLMIVIVIVAVLNSIGLLIMDVPFAIFFGVLGSILTIIPYIGIMLGASFPALFVLITHNSLVDALIVIGIFAFVQFLEGNFITPNIVGSRVSINPFAAVMALIIGGEVWGAAGMILAIPAIAVMKVLFDAYEPLRPFGFLLCDISEYKKNDNIFNKFKIKMRQRKKP